MAVQFTKLSVSPEVVQTTGTSETAVMSQKAVTDALASAGGGGSSGGLVLKSIDIGSGRIAWYNNLRTVLDKGIFPTIKLTLTSSQSNLIPMTTHTVNMSTGEHNKSASNKEIFTNGYIYLFTVSSYDNSTIRLNTFGSGDNSIQLILTANSGTWYVRQTYMLDNTAYTLYGSTSMSSLTGGTAMLYYYDTE